MARDMKVDLKVRPGDHWEVSDTRDNYGTGTVIKLNPNVPNNWVVEWSDGKRGYYFMGATPTGLDRYKLSIPEYPEVACQSNHVAVDPDSSASENSGVGIEDLSPSTLNELSPGPMEKSVSDDVVKSLQDQMEEEEEEEEVQASLDPGSHQLRSGRTYTNSSL